MSGPRNLERVAIKTFHYSEVVVLLLATLDAPSLYFLKAQNSKSALAGREISPAKPTKPTSPEIELPASALSPALPMPGLLLAEVEAVEAAEAAEA